MALKHAAGSGRLEAEDGAFAQAGAAFDSDALRQGRIALNGSQHDRNRCLAHVASS